MLNTWYLGSVKGREDSQLGPQKETPWRGQKDGVPLRGRNPRKTGAEGEPVMCISKTVQLCRVCRSEVGKEEISCGGKGGRRKFGVEKGRISILLSQILI